MSRFFVLLCLLAACSTKEPERAPVPVAQTAEQAADLLCRAAGEVAGDPETDDAAHWWEATRGQVTHAGVRDVFEAMAKAGRDPSGPFFEGMADVLGHPWQCPAATKILSPR